jgi:hypothetical protein
MRTAAQLRGDASVEDAYVRCNTKTLIDMMPPKVRRNLVATINTEGCLQAVKKYREYSGLRFHEAKDVVWFLSDQL